MAVLSRDRRWLDTIFLPILTIAFWSVAKRLPTWIGNAGPFREEPAFPLWLPASGVCVCGVLVRSTYPASSLLSAVAGWTFTRTYNLTSNRATTFTTSVGTWSSLCSMHCRFTLTCDLACVKPRGTLRYLVKRIPLPPSTCPHRPTIQPPVRTHARTCCAVGRRLYTGPDCRGLSALRGIHVSNHTATESVQCS